MDDFDGFCGGVCNGIQTSDFPADTAAVLAFDDGPDILLAGLSEAAVGEEVAKRVTPAQEAVALATRVLWSPDEGPTTAAWVVAAVTKGRAAFFAVKRHVEDTGWWHLEPTQAPWFALSTASALRAAIERGEPPMIKTTMGPELFMRPDQLPSPPVGEDGRL